MMATPIRASACSSLALPLTLANSRVFHYIVSLFFFFQAEDGIRDLIVTGVQTCVFFFSSRRRHTRSDRDWSSDVCSSDLLKYFYFERDVLSSVRDACHHAHGLGLEDHSRPSDLHADRRRHPGVDRKSVV